MRPLTSTIPAQVRSPEVELQPEGQVRMQADVPLPVRIEQAWKTISMVESFACIDYFHYRIRSEDPARPWGRILIDHGFFGFRHMRRGKIYGWRDGSEYRFSDLALRDKRRGFPHVYIFKLRPAEEHHCSLRIEINGRWTAAWIPRTLVLCWLHLIFAKIVISARSAILLDALEALPADESLPFEAGC